jgi:glycogen synthase
MTADTVGGVWVYAVELARALADRGVEIVLATMGRLPAPDQREAARRTPNLTLLESAFKLEWMADPWDDVDQAGKWLLDIADQTRPDIVHLNNYVHGSLPWRVPTIIVGHSCVCSWWQAVRGAPAPDEWASYRRLVRQGLRSADLVITPTNAMRESLIDQYGPLPQTRVIPNGRDPARFPPGQKEALILTAGRLWDEAKNVSSVARTASSLPWRVCLAGEVRHPDGGRAQLDGVDLLGWLTPDTLADWLGRASIYCLPARYEPFGLSALEAGLAGCALVLGDIPSLREVWRDAAVFVPPDDLDALRSTMRDLIADSPDRTTLAAKARRRALEFTTKRMADNYLASYLALVPGHQHIPHEERSQCAS